jgi:hypothetical protein
MTESTTMKVEDQIPNVQEASQTANGDAAPVNWESEIQLVSSLAKLQELERKVSVEPHCCRLAQLEATGLRSPFIYRRPAR